MFDRFSQLARMAAPSERNLPCADGRHSAKMHAVIARAASGRPRPCRSFGGQWLGAAGGRSLLLSPEEPGLQPVEVDIDDRRRIEGENLR